MSVPQNHSKTTADQDTMNITRQVGFMVFIQGGSSTPLGSMHMLSTNSSHAWIDLSNIVGSKLYGSDSLQGHVLVAAPPLLLTFGGRSQLTNVTTSNLFGYVLLVIYVCMFVRHDCFCMLRHMLFLSSCFVLVHVCVCVCVCLCVCVCVCTYIRTYIHTYIHTCIHTCIHTHTYIHYSSLMHVYTQQARCNVSAVTPSRFAHLPVGRLHVSGGPCHRQAYRNPARQDWPHNSGCGNQGLVCVLSVVCLSLRLLLYVCL
jgi:hypothetical protein